MRKKVTVVGGGFVGSTTAQRIHDAGLADVVLTDILDGVPAGKALDMAESGPIMGSDARAGGISTARCWKKGVITHPSKSWMMT